MSQKDLPESFTCTGCNKVHELGAWVCAHWYETITHTCDCGAKHDLLEGLVTRAILPEPKGDKAGS